MRAEIEAEIAKLESQLAGAKAKLEQMVQSVPQEYHSLTREMFDRIKAFFE
jgi:chromosome segregation ATPase